MKTISIVCAGCKKVFEKPKNEWARQVRKDPNREFYCCMSCYGGNEANKHLGHHLGRGNASLLNPGNRQDNLSSFRYFMNKARNRHRDYDIDLLYLKSLWEQQKGCCALSGIPMHLPRNTSDWEKIKWDPWRASLDRIDCSKGYMQGNVRFTTLIGNLCRNGFTDEDVLIFCEAVASKQVLL